MPVNNFDGNGNERICIQATKVFDACMKQITLQQTTINITDVTTTPTLPLRFVNGRSTSTTGTIQNLVVERLVERPKYGRVQGDVLVPVEITYIDANNVEGNGTGTITIPVDVVMYLPDGKVC